MNKAYAIARAGGPEHLDVKHTQFSNINAAKDVWWIDVPLSRLDDSALEQVDLLLFDDRSPTRSVCGWSSTQTSPTASRT
jgi:hypothetical protein